MTIESIVQWFNTAKPEPTNQDLVKQIAFCVEEFTEMLEAIRCDFMVGQMKTLKAELMSISDDRGACDHYVANFDKVALLDALCDQVVTATGVGVFMGAKFIPALEEVNASNYTKFKPYDGGYLPYIRPDGKIGKNPETYKEPELAQFLGG